MIRQVRDGDWMAVVIGVAFCTVVVTAFPWPLRVAVGAVLGLGLRSAIRWEAPPARRRAREKRYRAFSRWLLVSITLGYDRLSLRKTLGITLAAAGVVYLLYPERNFTSDTALGNLLIVLNSLSYGAYIRGFRHDHNKERGS